MTTDGYAIFEHLLKYLKVHKININVNFISKFISNYYSLYSTTKETNVQ